MVQLGLCATYHLGVVEQKHVGLLHLVHQSDLLAGSESGDGRALGQQLQGAHGHLLHHFFFELNLL